MADLSSFATSAKHLSRNPLGIIALFIVLSMRERFSGSTISMRTIHLSERPFRRLDSTLPWLNRRKRR